MPDTVSIAEQRVVEAHLRQLRSVDGLRRLLALAVGTCRKLTDEQAHLLREMLLKLNCRITIRNRAIFISGSLPLAGVRVNESAS